MKKKIFCSLLAAILVLTLPMPSFAAEAKEPQPEEEKTAQYVELTVSSPEDLESLAKRCRLDSASRNLKVTLTKNISLNGHTNLEIPTFGGIFDGQGHKITGFAMDAEGSAQGLFRYIQPQGVVKNLEVVGRLAPQGSASKIGGIAGVNEGTIENVSFYGTLSGANCLGGIAGTNAVTGKIRDCSAQGYIRGEKAVGGIVGENKGVVTNCVNRGNVNTNTPSDTMSLTDITITKLTSEETVLSGSDIGGVAGFSSGVVRLCRNEGNVGYPHTGYNVGGVVGSSSGFMADCVNYGAVHARKEGGGVLGQMEPSNVLEFSEDRLQKLDKELKATTAILDRMSADAHNANAAIKGQVANVQYNTSAFIGSVYYLVEVIEQGVTSTPMPIDEGEEIPIPSLNNADEIWAAAGDAGRNLDNSVQAIGGLSDTVTGQGDVIVSDMQSLTNQISRVVNVMSGREETEGIAQDVSGENVEEDSAGKIRNCLNTGAVDADINAGGIVGALSYENDLDPEDDLSTVGNASLNFSLKTRALVYQCTNRGTVRAKKQVAGGIAGQSVIGAVISCEGYGPVDGEDAAWVGGIAGSSEAEISDCWAKCVIRGGSMVGGIVGEGSEVEDCRALVSIDCGGEYVGAIAGKLSDKQSDPVVSGNYFVDSDTLAGIDGISYAGSAEPRAYNSFMNLEGVPDPFRKMVLTFVADDTVITRRVDYGMTLLDVPEVPQKEGYSGVWKDLNTKQVRTDQRVYAEYTVLQGSVDSGTEGMPVALAEGSFPEGKNMTAQELTAGLPGGAQFGWTLEVPDDGQSSHRIHLKKPDKTKEYQVYLNTGSGWQAVDAAVDGSYLVFTMEGSTAQAAVKKLADYTPLWVGVSAAAGLLLLTGVILAAAGKKKKARKTQKT